MDYYVRTIEIKRIEEGQQQDGGIGISCRCPPAETIIGTTTCTLEYLRKSYRNQVRDYSIWVQQN